MRYELTYLWQQITGVCKEIIDVSVSLLHQDPSSMVEILLNDLRKPKEDLSLQSLCVQISYLNLKDNLKKVIDHPKIFDLTEKICQLNSDLIQNSYKDCMKREMNNSRNELIEHTTKSYILNYTQLVLRKYCETQENMMNLQKKLNNSKLQVDIQGKVENLKD